MLHIKRKIHFNILVLSLTMVIMYSYAPLVAYFSYCIYFYFNLWRCWFCYYLSSTSHKPIGVGSSSKGFGLGGILPLSLRFKFTLVQTISRAIGLRELPLELFEVHLWKAHCWGLCTFEISWVFVLGHLMPMKKNIYFTYLTLLYVIVFYRWDIIAERLGFMLVFGDLVWIPFTFSIQACDSKLKLR